MIVHALGSEREVAIALNFVAQRPDHLRMAEVATLADIDVSAGQFERRIWPNAIDSLDRALEVEKRGDLDQTAYSDDSENSHDQDDRILLEDLMPCPERHLTAPHSAG